MRRFVWYAGVGAVVLLVLGFAVLAHAAFHAAEHWLMESLGW